MSYSSSVRDANEMLYEPDREYHLVRLRATLLDEAEGERLIIGVNYIDK